MDPLPILIALGILYLVVFFKTARIILGLTLLGAVLGACVGIAVQSRAFVPWEPLGMPPSGAVEITQVTDDRIYVKATDGEAYSCDFSGQIRCWVGMESGDSQQNVESQGLSYGPTPEVEISKRRALVTYSHFEGGSRREFELRGDGSIWTRSAGWAGVIVIGILVLSSLAGAAIGLLIAAVVVIVQPRRKRAHASVT